ncbi:hypothetical protein PP2015_3363 [Pseudoalteromonas phenolica]|uniref:Uncharacterized protein n=1 Tax=Pseudoalteromonas phenolica TaxID=161398 RepID=A0A0S2K6W8_9GAMM|nr:hypothetical protein PP2015_3363 [Pseudoalteromonas phenolica]
MEKINIKAGRFTLNLCFTFLIFQTFSGFFSSFSFSYLNALLLLLIGSLVVKFLYAENNQQTRFYLFLSSFLGFCLWLVSYSVLWR